MDLFGRKKRRDKKIVEEFRLRLRDEIIDVTARAIRAGRTSDMRRLQDEILGTIHAKVLEEVADKYRLLPGDVRELIARYPSEDEDKLSSNRSQSPSKVALQIDDKSDAADALYKKGVSLMQNEQNDLALLTMREALFHDPKHVNALCGCGSVLIKLKRYQAAEEEFRKALQIDTSSTMARVGFGQSLAAQGKHKEALKEFDAVLAIDSADFSALFSSALSYAGLREWGSALAAIDLALEVQPEMPLARALRQQILAVQSL